MSEQSELEGWLSEIEAQIAPLLVLRTSLRQRLGMDPDGDAPSGLLPVAAAGAGASRNAQASAPAHVGPLRSDTFFRLSIPDAIKKYLGIAKRPMGPKAIADALKQGGVLSQASHFYANVTTALKRLRDQGEVVNTKEGWGLAEWYPNTKAKADVKPKKKAKATKKKGAAPAAPKQLTSGTGEVTYTQFVALQRKDGKTMAEAAKAWNAMKGK